jgi:hypothetical protein
MQGTLAGDAPTRGGLQAGQMPGAVDLVIGRAGTSAASVRTISGGIEPSSEPATHSAGTPHAARGLGQIAVAQRNASGGIAGADPQVRSRGIDANNVAGVLARLSAGVQPGVADFRRLHGRFLVSVAS